MTGRCRNTRQNNQYVPASKPIKKAPGVIGRLDFLTHKGAIAMRNQYEKYIRVELLTFALAVVIGLIAIVQGFVIIMLLCVYLLAFSIFCEGFLFLNTNRPADAIKQIAKAGMLMLLATILFLAL